MLPPTINSLEKEFGGKFAKQAIRDGQGAAAEYIIDNAAKLLRGE